MSKLDDKTIVKEAVNVLLELLNVPGISTEEFKIEKNLIKQLIKMGVPSSSIFIDEAQSKSSFGGDAGNLIVVFDGNEKSDRILFSAHMDTVPITNGCQPFLDIESGKIINKTPGTALGGDNRTGCAVLLLVARKLLYMNVNERPPVTMVFSVQEELGLIGAGAIDLEMLGGKKPAMGFNFDGSNPGNIVVAVIGTKRFFIDICGVATHAGLNPAGGASAFMIACNALENLRAEGWVGEINKENCIGSSNPGVVNGGSGSNIIMPNLSILAEARSFSPKALDTIINKWKETFEKAVLIVGGYKKDQCSVTFRDGPAYLPYHLPEDSLPVKIAEKAAENLSLSIIKEENCGGMDSNHYVNMGIPSVTIGCGQREVHTVTEWIDLENFKVACQLALKIVDELV